ncbi:MAG: hypothetical protein A3A80_01340 [Candidatus Terrybacteria bacterium RIFCSPLOWO2_01_FULL_44_24]|uniref:alanine--tRNA ligase n=1 Tax=Candidatus Terrybacteria bacterium RIFCSPHIGHO2_01_FULL_43_35 TaxID=1802361 RepID=A0A1G2PHG4_9BACT|nr:MAG: hypothetical protein A2828_03715 [Candidatus Terrybacteria bacterium RIFCSPHIGHO2_01_FULL_43_35]OHA49952.1 MAG: hypothetical protein A3B75_03585 [Candidatus Terrybacteria bacterium RIFCSPHIGHO2_02_FULL_43_14]OHA51726.1 MAG: hypothetical protein A3A80_01340 [Candidatus Terrybacteria bacterium RIFCSPLOWO2_01_FULL_44_24]
MTFKEIREKFIKFFERHGHTAVPSSSLIPDDPSVLLTTAGMQQFKPYWGELDPEQTIHPSIGKPVGKNAVSIQKSFRTSDIDEVGDESHLTFFEMMGNFSFGGYFKKEAIAYAHEFLTKELGLKISYVTVFEGNEAMGVPEDKESAAIWKELDPAIRIEKQGMENVFWGPTGASGPCGPTTEVYFKNAQGQDIETWNLVFNEYFYPGSREELLNSAPGKKLEKLKTPGVDTGMGLERIAMIVQEKKNIFETDLFEPILRAVIEIQGDKPIQQIRLIADHLRAVTFLIADGLEPGIDERNYIPRRLIRDAMTAHYLYIGAGIDINFCVDPVNTIIDIYRKDYPYLLEKREEIISIIRKETENFSKVLKLVGNVLDLKKQYISFSTEKKWPEVRSGTDIIDLDGKILFDIRQSIGVSWSQMKMVIEKEGFELGDKVLTEYDEAYKKHQELSRAGQERKFGGHGLLLDTGELKAANEEELKKVTRLHTATHMLQAALRQILGQEIYQMGSDITVERLRFDFTFSRKVTPEELLQVESLVRRKVSENLPVNKTEMPIEDAKNSGALTVATAKYPPMVKVYSIDDFSREVCGGPHVSRTSEVGEFKIIKEEASSTGIRRIRAVVSP